jgi:hypothetical protein
MCRFGASAHTPNSRMSKSHWGSFSPTLKVTLEAVVANGSETDVFPVRNNVCYGLSVSFQIHVEALSHCVILKWEVTK